MSNGEVGNTFLMWSLYYLSGETENLVIDRHDTYFYNKLPSSPINTTGVKNAHLHLKTHPHGKDSFDKRLTRIKLQPNQDRLYCMFPTEMDIISAGKHLYGKDITSMSHMPDIDKITEYRAKDYAAIAESCYNNNVKLIYNISSNHLKYSYKPREFGDALDGTKVTTILEKIIKNVIWGYPGIKERFNNFKNTWDIREGLAIGLGPDSEFKRNKFFDYSHPHLYLEATSFQFDGIYTIKNIMNYLGLDINQNRWDHWKTVYYQWQEITQLTPNRLIRNIDHVCDSIVNSWNHDLTQYDLDLIDEAFIQHMLIYKYNITIKGYGLEEFPGNAKDFRDLIEPAFYKGLIHKEYA